VELSLELLLDGEAGALPVGKGRAEPNLHPKLEEPNRPDDSFLWILSPWKAMRYILWKNYKDKIMILLGIIIFCLFCYVFYITFPEIFMNKVSNAARGAGCQCFVCSID
jgi:dysferlin